jgi:hypothetical protein
LLFSLLPPHRSLSCYKNSCDMGDWVAHLSNTAARKILVTYPLLAVVSEEGSPEPPTSGRTSRQKACYSFSVTLGLPFAFPFSSRRRDF